ncbi:nitrate reductase molybdenum cofactor assembly chaperone [Terasakiispira papahanaumokuakeensis]|nr:nitrate reductase molybdenum cofactor assembly chaperone [Terasakiispira papahanaumokuakeensis]
MISNTAMTLRALARLLDYPDPQLIESLADIDHVMDQDGRLPEALKPRFHQWTQTLRSGELFDHQAIYVEQFDRGRQTSLLLFEHVHGESRDRGQAMVDLLNEYQTAGMTLATHELPDHLPVVLEYLSTRDDLTIGQWLGDLEAILARLGARLSEAESDYALIFQALLALIGASDQLEIQRPEIKHEVSDKTPEALDAVWEEEAVRFHAQSDEDCALQSAQGRHLAAHKRQTASDPVRLLDTQGGL